jgi:hypothetical protein
MIPAPPDLRADGERDLAAPTERLGSALLAASSRKLTAIALTSSRNRVPPQAVERKPGSRVSGTA